MRKITWVCVCVCMRVCVSLGSPSEFYPSWVCLLVQCLLRMSQVFRLDVICSHIILSNRNKKQPERFPEEQLAHANMRLLILILVVMTFPQLPHWPESHFLALLSVLLSGRYRLVSYFDSPEKNHEQVWMLWLSQMLGICRKCHLNL